MKNPLVGLNYRASIILERILYALSFLFPRSHGIIVFGSWMGNSFSDNPKYLFLHLLQHSTARLVWIGRKVVERCLPHNPRVTFAELGSWKAFWFLARSRIWCVSQNFTDVSPRRIYGGVRLINLYHGIPLKFLGRKTPFYIQHSGLPSVRSWKTVVNRFFGMLRAPEPKFWTSISSPRMGELMHDGYPVLFPENRMLRAGTVRNDYLIQNKSNGALRKALKLKYAKLFKVDCEARFAVYLPTWRINGGKPYAFFALSDEAKSRLSVILKSANAILIEKHHPLTYKTLQPPDSSSDRIAVVLPEHQIEIDTQELLLCADILVTDYSSAYIDFALLERPCIHFAHCHEEYVKEDSGLAYDFERVKAGPIVKNFDDFLLALGKAFACGVAFDVGTEFESMIEFERGCAAEAVQKELLEKSRP